MFKNLTLTRPLAILDLETTGIQVQEDRIVEISILKIFPDGTLEHRTRRINPGIPIPPGATAIHGISDADVADAPRFEQLADGMLAFLQDCDLCGFNIKRFDLRLLQAEVERAGRKLPLEGRAIIDAQQIFHSYERRDLAAAVRHYCGREHTGHHSAEADVRATAEILDAMMARYTDLPRSVAELCRHFTDPNAVDAAGKFVRVSGRICFTFGKQKGRALDDIAQMDSEYLKWILKSDFNDDTKAVVKDALDRIVPTPSSPPAEPVTPMHAVETLFAQVCTPNGEEAARTP